MIRIPLELPVLPFLGLTKVTAIMWLVFLVKQSGIIPVYFWTIVCARFLLYFSFAYIWKIDGYGLPQVNYFCESIVCETWYFLYCKTKFNATIITQFKLRFPSPQGKIKVELLFWFTIFYNQPERYGHWWRSFSL